MSKYSEPTGKPAFKKKKQRVKRGGLSFGEDEEQVGDSSVAATPADVSRSNTPAQDAPPTDSEDPSDTPTTTVKKRLRPNSSITLQPKAMTKSALLRETQLKESLRKEYLQLQEAVKQTDFMLPFVFFDGKDISGGKCRMKKGDFIWLFIERARKIGADLAQRAGERRMKDWARIGVDDLMIVREGLILGHVRSFVPTTFYRCLL